MARSKQQPLSDERRRVLWQLSERFGWLCWYCGIAVNIDTVWIDHIDPRSNGGGNEITNLALSCKMCNRAKWNMPAEVFLDWLNFVRCDKSITRVVLEDRQL